MDLYRTAVRGRGADPDIGPRLPGMLRDVGLAAVDFGVVQPAAMEGDVKLLAPITFEAIASTLVAQELVTIREVGRLRLELWDYAAIRTRCRASHASCRRGPGARRDEKRLTNRGRTLHGLAARPRRRLARHREGDQRPATAGFDDTAPRAPLGASDEHDRHVASRRDARRARDRWRRARLRDAEGGRVSAWLRAHG